MMTATMEVVIWLKSNTALRRFELSGIAVSRMSVICMAVYLRCFRV